MKLQSICLAASLFLLTISNAFAEQKASSKTPSNIVPDWQLTMQNGEPINWKMFEGKPVILHFWATWCPYCKRLQPKLVELVEKHPEVVLVGISFNEDEDAKPQDVLAERGYTFKTAVNGEEAVRKFGVSGTPTTFFIKRNGEAIFKYTSSDIKDPRLLKATQVIAEK
ncbi:TlpA family protein disulfide reductase [Thalassotalea montiporae]